ncbi:MAG: RHS repeat-associated core domain-containing protein, partial [Candidatus Carbobacillus sp.]|nr:RHS repeat-associated core domain-containing protein [Candidatus Carbobacillus sp.]
NTPQRVYISPLGVAFKTEDDNRADSNDTIAPENTVTTIQTLDILGQITAVKDALGRSMTQNTYDMAGQLIMTSNIDSGKRWIIYNAAKMPIYVWDSRDQRTTNEYDELLRPKNTYLKAGTATEKKVQQIEYGTNANLNNIGQVENLYSQDGKTNFYLYDFKNNLLTLKKKFAVDYQNTLDYNGTVTLQTEEFITETSFDALNRPINIDSTLPPSPADIPVPPPDPPLPPTPIAIPSIQYVYNKGGLLEQVLYDEDEYISRIEYNARGQRTEIYYGNGTKTGYTYDDENFRLANLLTTKDTGSVVLQNLTYTYDSVGNIISINDTAQSTNYFGNAEIQPLSTYEYDALYRLIKATGREKSGLNYAPSNTDLSSNSIPVPPASASMYNYTQKYTYDKLGNILNMKSITSNPLNDNWSRDYFYDDQVAPYYVGTNRLLRHSGTIDQYTYDAHGNMLSMPHLSLMDWDYKDQLFQTVCGTVTSYYNYDANGERTRKVVLKQGGIREERYYNNGCEVYRKYISDVIETERATVHIAEDRKRFAIIDLLIVEEGDLSTTPETTVRYQYDNHLGSSCLELDASANIISYEEYHPFGTTSYRSGRNEVDVSLKRYRYVGKERDEETGLYYYGARYYAAWLCRFVSVDPMADQRSWVSPYSYCQNSPIIRTDPTGALDNPILSYSGKLLGYDERGKGGEAIIMKTSDYFSLKKENGVFKNITQAQAEQYGKYYSQLSSSENFKFMQSGYGSMKEIQYDFNAEMQNKSNMLLTAPIGTNGAGTQSISAGFAFGGGYELELGIITDSQGLKNFYFSHGPTIGYYGGISYNEASIYTNDGSPFINNMYEGKSSGWDASLFMFGFTNSGDIPLNSTNKDALINYGDNYLERGYGIGKGPKGINVGFKWSEKSTILY